MLKEIVKLPKQRQIWLIRKLYAGNGGVLPPTDPRILALTEEQIALDFLNYQLDHPEKFKETYTDDQYEDHLKEIEEEDTEPKTGDSKQPEALSGSSGEWEDVPEEVEGVV